MNQLPPIPHNPMPPVPITLITGFLGSGKSTLINRLLTLPHGLRLVIIENEFSPTPIERAIVTNGTSSPNFIQLPNGCICCASMGELADTLSRLAAQGGVDHVLVEASGLADPIPLVAELWTDDGMGVVLDGVVAVVDARNVERCLEDETSIAEKQLVLADLVLLNKVDLVEDHDIHRIKAVLKAHACNANVVTTTRCDTPIRSLLGLHAYHASKPPVFQTLHTHPSMATVTKTYRGVFDEAALERALAALLWEEAFQVWRMKALVCVGGVRRKRIYQGVRTLFDYEESDVEWDDESCFLFIGKGIGEEVVEKALRGALVGG